MCRSDARSIGFRDKWLRAFLVVVAVLMAGCRTMSPHNKVLIGLHEKVLQEPSDRLLTDRELPRERADMARWLEHYLKISTASSISTSP